MSDQFNTCPKPSFGNVDKLFGWISHLPSGAQWQVMKVQMQGYDTKGQDIRLIWQDGMEVVRDLFSNPIFANYMTYDPHKVMCGAECEYSEFFTSTCAFEIQASGSLQRHPRVACSHRLLHYRTKSLMEPPYLLSLHLTKCWSPVKLGAWKCTLSS